MKLNHIISIILLSVTLFTGCAKTESVAEETTVSETTFLDTTVATTTAVTTIDTEPTTTETTVETTTATTVTTAETTVETTVETTRELTAEEIEIMNEMPEIVFVMSHYFSGENINGFYITKNGEVKMFDFKGQEEQIRYVPDILDKLEDATCSEMIAGNELVQSNKLRFVPEYKMVEYYKTLLLINENSEIIRYKSYEDADFGYGSYYGIRNNNGNTEIITLSGWGDSYNVNTDELSSELSYRKVFPQFFYPY